MSAHRPWALITPTGGSQLIGLSCPIPPVARDKQRSHRRTRLPGKKGVPGAMETASEEKPLELEHAQSRELAKKKNNNNWRVKKKKETKRMSAVIELAVNNWCRVVIYIRKARRLDSANDIVSRFLLCTRHRNCP